MVRKAKRQTVDEQQSPPEPSFAQPATGISAWFRDRGVRETIESVLIAVVLALMFRAFEAEAFIIPTGSMAPTLQGRHFDLKCEKCGYRYRTGASCENPDASHPDRVEKTICPICQYTTTLNRRSSKEHRSFAGDRILVNKFAYDFDDPKRWDVIVFKNPNNGKQNYIKRLIGLPNESILLEYGDVYAVGPDGTTGERGIQRKSPEKLRAMLQLVDDTHHIPRQLQNINWPSRWNQWRGRSGSGDWHAKYVDGKPYFQVAPSDDEERWLRYRHIAPLPEEWPEIELGGDLPYRVKNHIGELITDYYAYNEKELRTYKVPKLIGRSGLHWVGDLALEADLDVASSDGQLLLDAVEGGVHFRCSIDVASGVATLSASSDTVQFVDDAGALVAEPKGQTRLTGPGRYNVAFANADDQLYLWINGSAIRFDGSRYRRSGEVLPKWTLNDGLDAEPLGIGSRGVEMEITRLKVLRDVYYTSVFTTEIEPPELHCEYLAAIPQHRIRRILQNPAEWNTEEATQLFRSRSRKGLEQFVFQLSDDQFFPMGDNSPESLDARVWDGPPFVDRSFLLGKAMYIYWPHSKVEPIPFFPNFERMGFIR